MVDGAGIRRTHRVNRGLTIPLAGKPEQTHIDRSLSVTRVAVLGGDYRGLRPKLLVDVGDSVMRGQVLFEDRKNPAARIVSPAAGKVQAINRGERRTLLSVVISLSDEEMSQATQIPEVSYAGFCDKSATELTGQELGELFREAGLWAAFRTRPFGRIPEGHQSPRAIFVTAMDTQPLAPDTNRLLAEDREAFALGLAALVKLGSGVAVHLCVGSSQSLAADLGVQGVTEHVFAGPHPAGLPGVHMNRIDPVALDRVAWSIGLQDVIMTGAFLRDGKQCVRRVIALGGSAVRKPRLVETRLGANLSELLSGELVDGPRRLISGSVLSGRDAAEPEVAFLGRFHQQVTVIGDRRQRRLLGWMAPRLREVVALDPLTAPWLSSIKLDLTSAVNGEHRPLIPIGRYEQVWPYRDIVPSFLFRAVLSGDVVAAESQGILELDDDDVALCSFLCPSKIDFGRAIRDMLLEIEKDSQ